MTSSPCSTEASTLIHRPHGWWWSLLRVPYKVGGRTTNGADCYGLTRLALKRGWGIDLDPFDLGYVETGDPLIGEAVLDQIRRGPWRPVTAPTPGDIVLANVRGWHMGTVIEPEKVLTTQLETGGPEVEDFREGWSSVGHFYRHRELIA